MVLAIGADTALAGAGTVILAGAAVASLVVSAYFTVAFARSDGDLVIPLGFAVAPAVVLVLLAF